jgi:hypothetical protein
LTAWYYGIIPAVAGRCLMRYGFAMTRWRDRLPVASSHPCWRMRAFLAGFVADDLSTIATGRRPRPADGAQGANYLRLVGFFAAFLATFFAAFFVAVFFATAFLATFFIAFFAVFFAPVFFAATFFTTFLTAFFADVAFFTTFFVAFFAAFFTGATFFTGFLTTFAAAFFIGAAFFAAGFLATTFFALATTVLTLRAASLRAFPTFFATDFVVLWTACLVSDAAVLTEVTTALAASVTAPPICDTPSFRLSNELPELPPSLCMRCSPLR